MSTATHEQRDATERYITDLERRLAEVEDAARGVCRVASEPMMPDIAEAVMRLQEVLGPEQPIGDEPSQ